MCLQLSLESQAQLFAKAEASLRAGLPAETCRFLKEFHTKDGMLKEMESVCSKHKDSSRLSSCCAKIARFASAFEPYFDTINIFVQVKPEYVAPFWGSIKIILQVCSSNALSAGCNSCSISRRLTRFQLGANHVTFLEKVGSMFEVLSFSLPQCQEFYESCRQKSCEPAKFERLVKLLSLVYEDVIAFCGEVIVMLCRRRRGKPCRTLLITVGICLNPLEHKGYRTLRLMRDTVWTTFDGRFGKLIERMKLHQDLFSQEMRIQDQRLLMEQFEQIEQDRQGLNDREKVKLEAEQRRDMSRLIKLPILTPCERFANTSKQ